MKKSLLALFLTIAFASAFYFLYYKPRRSAKVLASDVLQVSGNIEAHESLVSFKVPGRIVELPVEEGQWVQEGDILARLDDSDYRQQVEMDQSALGVRQAELRLALAGTRRQELEVAEQAVHDAEADLAQRTLDYSRAEELYRSQVGTKEARDQAETNLKRAQTSFERARQRYSEAREGTRKEEIGISRALVRQAEEKLALSRLNLEYTLLHAPKTGMVLVRNAELGEVVQPGTPVVTVADLDNIWLRAYIPETDLGRVRWGQSATVRTDTFPDKKYAGRVSFIASKAEFTPKTVQTQKERVTLVYRIKIDLQNPNHELKPGMPADAAIALTPPETRNSRSPARPVLARWGGGARR